MRLTNNNMLVYDKELQDIYIEKNNIINMLDGCINRICVTDNEEEITRMFKGATRNLLKLCDLNSKRIKIISLIEKEGENNE